MKIDALFFSLFQKFPSIFFGLMAQSSGNAGIYEFVSVRIQEPVLQFNRVLHFLRPKEESPGDPIYFVEIQVQEQPQFYSQLFAAIYLYFNHYEPQGDWRMVVIFKSRSIECLAHPRYQELMDHRVIRIYLDELEAIAEPSMDIGVIQLIMAASKEQLIGRAKRLLERSRNLKLQEGLTHEQVLESVKDITLYRFPSISQEELDNILAFAGSDAGQSSLEIG